WWAANQGKPADQFRADLLDRYRREQAQAAAGLEPLLTNVYRRQAADQKGDTLQLFLSDPNPAVRAIGIRLAKRDMTTTGRDPGGADKAVLPRVQALVGDSAAEVRAEAADMLGAINDRSSLPRLLTQLQQEPDPTVKAALIKAVQPMQDPRTVPTLINLLRDP